MKISPHAFTRFWDVHAWAGAVGGLVLYLMFLLGSITLFHEELDLWQEPLAQHAPVGDINAVLERALAGLPDKVSELWFYPTQVGAPRLGFSDPVTGQWKEFLSDPSSGKLLPEREHLSGFIYSLHYLSHEVTGDVLYYCAGLLAVLYLLAIVTGVLIHVKDIVRQFHQFRPERSRRVMWSDMHKVLGVMGLPFQLMYTYTGAFIVLGPLLLRGFTGPVFDGDATRADHALWGDHGESPKEPGKRTQVLPLDELTALARKAESRLQPDAYQLIHHGHENGIVEVHGLIDGTPNTFGSVRMRETDGSVLHIDAPGHKSAIGSVQGWVFGLHFAHFGGYPVRFLFLVLGLAGCATILTGNWVWLARRNSTRESLGNRMLARLTIGFGAGSFVAVAGMFLASRLFPLQWSARGVAEEWCFVGALSACIAWALLARDERSLWWQQLALAGVLLLPVPLLAARFSSAGLFGDGAKLPTVVGVDIGIFVTALMLCASSVVLRHNTQRALSTGDSDA